MIDLPWPPKELSPNARVHWTKKAKAAKAYRLECFILAKALGMKAPTGRVALSGPAEQIKNDESVRRAYLGY